MSKWTLVSLSVQLQGRSWTKYRLRCKSCTAVTVALFCGVLFFTLKYADTRMLYKLVLYSFKMFSE